MKAYRVVEMRSAGDKDRVGFKTLGSGLTKREAVDLMMTRRKPKTPILRAGPCGHEYRFWPRSYR